MTVFERIENLRKASGMSQGKLEKALGFSNGSISKWKNSMPTPDRLQKLAEYFDVSVDYLMTGVEDSKKEESPFTARDERDIKKSLDKIMSSLETKDGAPLYYDGNELELNDENKAMLRDAFNTALHTVKLINKEKFNPHKNGK